MNFRVAAPQNIAQPAQHQQNLFSHLRRLLLLLRINFGTLSIVCRTNRQIRVCIECVSVSVCGNKAHTFHYSISLPFFPLGTDFNLHFPISFWSQSRIFIFSLSVPHGAFCISNKWDITVWHILYNLRVGLGLHKERNTEWIGKSCEKVRPHRRRRRRRHHVRRNRDNCFIIMIIMKSFSFRLFGSFTYKHHNAPVKHCLCSTIYVVCLRRRFISDECSATVIATSKMFHSLIYPSFRFEVSSESFLNCHLFGLRCVTNCHAHTHLMSISRQTINLVREWFLLCAMPPAVGCWRLYHCSVHVRSTKRQH